MDEVKEEELREFEAKRKLTGDSATYSLGDRIGRKGLERRYEADFRGRDGLRYVKVNAFGKVIEEVSEMPGSRPIPGYDLTTTLNMDLQVLAESLLVDSVRGAVVALDPRNGEVLVMASSPRMDPNIFSLGKEKRSKEWAKLALDPAMPLNNRAVVGGYEPASTFKGILSIASLENGRIGPKDHMAKGCMHGYKFGNRTWKCWTDRGHGKMNMIDAFRESCDVYYYQAGLMLGMENINRWADAFGFGQETGIDLESERKGLLMDSATYERLYRKRGWRWSRGLVLNLSIGQGQIATPLQLANYAAGLANGRRLYRPHLGKVIRRASGELMTETEPEILHEIALSKIQHETILESMRQVLEAPHGTGGRARVPGVVVGGKTGSAENPHGEQTHALFICVAPLYAPEIAIAVVLENVGHGGSQAAPVAGSLLNRYFHGRPNGT
jgi:penicillin-binding protein 2